MLAHGIFCYQGHVGFISSAHNEADIAKALAAATEGLNAMKKEGLRQR
jgi:glutamate-1-semialdehyde aminotransferase